jgi:hypothetical protein
VGALLIRVSDANLDNQRTEHAFSHAVQTILHWHSFWDPRVLLNPLRVPIQWYYGRVLSTFIDGEIQKRFAEMQTEKATNGIASTHKKKAKSVIALVLEEYINQQQNTTKQALESMELDPNFARLAANHIRLFNWAGNDTTATAIVYVFHTLSQNPAVLAKVREEHDAVFGPVEGTGDRLRNDPPLINKCNYTLAVIKETMRIWPPSSSIREGVSSVSLTDQTGTVVPTGGLNATIMHYYVHTNPRVWKRPLEFLPERWLVDSGHELYPPPGAWRPFEFGSRNCIGQTLVMNEIRIAVILAIRKFDIVPAYEEWDAMQLANEGLYAKMMRSIGFAGQECKTVFGDRAYQTMRSGWHPADGYPCRVSLAKR